MSKEIFSKYEDLIKKLLKGGLAGLLVALVVEFAINKLSLANFVFGRYVIFVVFFSWIGMCFTYGFKEMFEIMIKYRVKITVTLFLIATICGYSFLPTNPENVILGKVHIFGDTTYDYYSSLLNIGNKNVEDFLIVFLNNLSYAVLFLVSFEVFKVLADEDLFCYAGALVITFSSYMLYSFEYAVLFLLLLVVLIDSILNKKIGYKVGFLLIVLNIILAALTTNLGIVVSVGYAVLGLIIYNIISKYSALGKAEGSSKKNKKENVSEERLFLNKAIKNIVLGLIVGIILSIVLHLIFTEFGLEKIKTFEGKYGLFDEYYNLADVIIPYLKEAGETMNGNIISVFPIPFVVCFIFLLKNDDKMEEVVPFLVTSIVLMFWATIGKLGIVSDLFGLSLIGRNECAFGIGLANVFMLIYAFGRIRKRSISLSASAIVIILAGLVYAFYMGSGIFASRLLFNIVIIIFFLLAVLIFNSYDQKYRKVGAVFLIIVVLISGIHMNPIVKSDYAKVSTYINQNK